MSESNKMHDSEYSVCSLPYLIATESVVHVMRCVKKFVCGHLQKGFVMDEYIRKSGFFYFVKNIQ